MNRTDFLVASPGFLTGCARILDIGATLRYYSYTISDTPAEADTTAMASDWRVVGDDLRKAIEQYQPSK
jgi:hypothetical protein